MRDFLTTVMAVVLGVLIAAGLVRYATPAVDEVMQVRAGQ